MYQNVIFIRDDNQYFQNGEHIHNQQSVFTNKEYHTYLLVLLETVCSFLSLYNVLIFSSF